MRPDRRGFLLGALALTACGPRPSLPDSREEATGEGWPAIPPVVGDPVDLVPASPAAAACPALFPSYFLGGFEAAAHLRDGRHLDLTHATRHDEFARLDYQRLVSVGVRACRDGVSWPLSERRPGRFDLSRARAMARSAQLVGVKVVWGLMHYGWPHDLDVYGAEFPTRFAAYARAFASMMLEEGLADDLMVVPVNEPSFLAWAGGDVALLNPHEREHSTDLKFQLVRAAIEAIHAMREVVPWVRILHTDPLMNVAPRGDRPKEAQGAEDVRLFQYQATNMILGRTWESQLGGSSDLVDVLGVNYYRNNQRYLDGEFIGGDEPRYRPLSDMLVEVWQRYGKPMILSETGAEGDDRARWLQYVSFEAGRAMERGVPLHGVTWYPILNHPGWSDDRHIHNGLWDYADDQGERPIHEPLAEAILEAEGPLSALRDHYVLAPGCVTRGGSASTAVPRPGEAVLVR